VPREENVRNEHLEDELRNFQKTARLIRPASGERPVLAGVEIHGVSLPLIDSVGGDHLVWIDFDRRYDLVARIERARAARRHDVAEKLEECRQRAGVLLADVSGHRVTDGLVAAMLHQAFLLGAYYELDVSGEITTRLIQYVQKRFYESTNIDKFFTMLYGEISSSGRFRFVSAGHPTPCVFSAEYRRRERLDGLPLSVATPVGFLPPEDDPDRRGDPIFGRSGPPLVVNEIELLSAGDVLLLYTDGLREHAGGRFFDVDLEPLVVGAMDRSAEGISEAILEGIAKAGPRGDDLTFVVMKRC
jgi:serine phosphatase RsbU (regulator of sigma subunit)